MQNKCVMIADIKASRRLHNWPSVFRNVNDSLSKINSDFRSEIAADFVPTVGDEFQVALKRPTRAYDIYLTFSESIPVQARCGIGIGGMEKPTERIEGMRGTAFYRAREAIDLAKKLDRNVLLRSSDEPNLIEAVVNVLFHFVQALESRWTKRQREIVSLCRTQSDWTYKEIGIHFGITRQSVSQTLKSAKWEVVKEGEEVLRALLKDWSKLVNHNRLTSEGKGETLYRVC